MSSLRKRKMMLKKLNTFFENEGRLLTEKEYMAFVGVPYRLAMIDKFMGGWSRMINFLGFYYPRWKDLPVENKVVRPTIDLEALSEDDE